GLDRPDLVGDPGLGAGLLLRAHVVFRGGALGIVDRDHAGRRRERLELLQRGIADRLGVLGRDQLCAHSLSPIRLPSGSMSIWADAGSDGRPGMVMISPSSG